MIPARAGSHWDPAAGSHWDPVPPRNDLWQQHRGKEQDATAKGRRAVCSEEGKPAPWQYGGSEKPGVIRGKISRMRGCAI